MTQGPALGGLHIITEISNAPYAGRALVTKKPD